MFFALNKSIVCNSEQKYIVFNCNHKVIEVINENVDVFCKIEIPREINEKNQEISMKFAIKNCDGKKVTDLIVYMSSF